MNKKLTLYMETTKKTPEQTASEIQKLMSNYELRHFMFAYENGNISGVTFSIIVNDEELPFKLPINHLPLWGKAQQGLTRYIRDEEQARKVAWRQVYKWIQSQLSLVDTGIRNITETFFSDLIVENDKTTYQLFLEKRPALKEKS
jgi:hypothetical protein